MQSQNDAKLKLGLQIISTLKAHGYEAVFAGGCVRDRARGEVPQDYDIATSALPTDIQRLFERTVPVGVQFGVVIVLQDGVSFEVATFREEGGYQDGRRPTDVRFSSLEKDSARRDFKINGLYWDGASNDLIDLVGGMDDLRARRVSTIGDPDTRFQEDHLRILRAIRFATQLEFEIAPETFSSVIRNRALLKKVSPERIRDEFSKILTSCNPHRGMELLDQTGILDVLLPEVITMKKVEQPMEYHPEGDVFIHTMLLIKQLKRPELSLALGALFHDIAKPATFERAADRIRFHGHDRIGAEMTYQTLKRFAYPNSTIEIVCSLVAEHLRFKDAFQMRKSTLKRFLSLDRFDLHLELHRIDCLASHGKLDAYHFCTQKFEEFSKEPPPPLRLVTGEDLIGMGLRPGPSFKAILTAVEDAILEGTVSDREAGLALAKQLIPTLGAKDLEAPHNKRT